MPFTPSHAVVALPFVRTPLIPAAIAVGAMTPDLPLYVRGIPLPYGRTHDLLWLPLTLVIAAALLLLWRCVLRPAARELVPRWVARRVPADWDAGAGRAASETLGLRARNGRSMSWSHLALLVLSLAIGAVSHVLWDQFTHEGRWGVAALPALQEDWGPLVGYKWLQHGSSALGLLIIAVWVLVWLVRRRPAPMARRVLPGWGRALWWASLPATLGAAWLLGLAMYGPLDQQWTVAHLAYRVLPPACAVWGALTLLLCVMVQILRRRSHDSPLAGE